MSRTSGRPVSADSGGPPALVGRVAVPVVGGASLADLYPAQPTTLGRSVVCGSSYGRVYAFDLSKPAAPALVSTTTVGTGNPEVYRALVHGHHVYVAMQQTDTVEVWDYKNIKTPVKVATIVTGSGTPAGTGPRQLVATGRYLFIGEGGQSAAGRLRVVDIASPSRPVDLGTVALASGARPYGLACSGTHLYLTDYVEEALRIYDVSDPVAPVLRSNTPLGGDGDGYRVALEGSRVYVAYRSGGLGAGYKGLEIFDVSDPAAPVSLGTSATLRNNRSIAVANDRAYTVNAIGGLTPTGAGTVCVWDVSDPANIRLLHEVTPPSQLLPSGVAVIGDLMVVACNAGPDFVAPTQPGELMVYDLGATYHPAGRFGSLETGESDVRGDQRVGGSQHVGGGLAVGGHAQVDGDVGVSGRLAVADLYSRLPSGQLVRVPPPVDMHALAVGEETLSRLMQLSASTLTSGSLRLPHFTARKTETITQIGVLTVAAAGATPTLIRYGIFSVAANGDLTLIASTPNDTSLLAVAQTRSLKALSAPFNKVAGTRYAFGILVVTAAAAPTCTGSVPALSAEAGQDPRICAVLTGQTDLPATITAASLTPSNANPCGLMMP